jgi:DNA repair exonuclease SbcCD nuclease subunit
MRFQFMHAADLHLDTPFTGVHRVDAHLATKLRDATIEAFENLVAAALERSIAFVVIAGDVYDGPERGVRAQLAFRDGLKRLAQAGIRSFVVHGNHDPVDEGWSAVRQWPDGVTVFGAEEVATIPVERDGQTLALIHGISYSRRAVTENLALRFRRSSAHCFQVGVLHCNAGANTEHAPYSPCSIEDLLASGLDYWALGHVHVRQVLFENGPWIAYPGNLQGLSRKSSERGAKGALVVDVDDIRVARIDFIAMDTVRFDDLEIDIAGVPDVASLVDGLVDAARDRAAIHDGRMVVLRVAITGRGAVHRDLHRGDVRDQVLGPARIALASRTQSVWLDMVEDRTKPEIDIEALRGRGDFTADLIETVDSLLAAPSSARSELLASYLHDLPRSDLRQLIGDPVDAVATEDEIRRSLETALDRLTGVD